MKFFNLRGKDADELVWDGPLVSLTTVADFCQCSVPTPKRSARSPSRASSI